MDLLCFCFRLYRQNLILAKSEEGSHTPPSGFAAASRVPSTSSPIFAAAELELPPG